MLPFVLLTAAAVAVLLAAELRGARTVRWAAKPLASTGFLGAALAAGALHSGYGRAVLVALVLCWLGDVLLLGRARPAFLAGLGVFLLGHLAFAAAFARRGLDPTWTVGAALLAVPPAVAALRWLRPHVPDALRAPVHAYVAVISAMLALAVGAAPGAGAALALGALLFYVSDLAVARDRFVAPGPANKLWGLPLYYASTLVLASTVRGA